MNGIAPDDLRPIGVDLPAPLGERGFGSVRIMTAQQGARLAACAGRDDGAFEEDDATGSPPRQLPGQARSHDAAADDGDIDSALRHDPSVPPWCVRVE